MKPVPENLTKSIYRHVGKDLDPSMLAVNVKVAAAAMVGGLLSLMFCGQFGIALTSLAESMFGFLHIYTGSVACSIVCGAMFALFPILVLRFLLCRPLQFRVITGRYWYVMFLWFAVFGVILAQQGNHSLDVVTIGGWTLMALFSARIYAVVMNWFFPSMDTTLSILSGARAS